VVPAVIAVTGPALLKAVAKLDAVVTDDALIQVHPAIPVQVLLQVVEALARRRVLRVHLIVLHVATLVGVVELYDVKFHSRKFLVNNLFDSEIVRTFAAETKEGAVRTDTP